MSVTVERAEEGPCPVLRAAGEIDIQTGPEVRDGVLALVAEGHQRIVLDLAEVTFLDSSGIGALVACAKALAPDGRLLLARPQERVAKVLDLTGLGDLIEVFATVEQAQEG